MENISRTVLFQPFSTFVVTVNLGPIQISPVQDKTSLVESFVLSIDAAAGSAFIGDSTVTVASGLEIVAGAGPVLFENVNQKQSYELQKPLIGIAETVQCMNNEPLAIPFIIWDLSQIYLVAAAATTVRVAAFRAQYI